MKKGFRRNETEKKAARRVKVTKWAAPHLAGKPHLSGIARTRHPLDCGHTKCFCCHAAKIDGLKKASDERRILDDVVPWEMDW